MCDVRPEDYLRCRDYYERLLVSGLVMEFGHHSSIVPWSFRCIFGDQTFGNRYCYQCFFQILLEVLSLEKWLSFTSMSSRFLWTRYPFDWNFRYSRSNVNLSPSPVSMLLFEQRWVGTFSLTTVVCWPVNSLLTSNLYWLLHHNRGHMFRLG